MTIDPERWRRLEELYHAACERPDADRAAFLARACAGDADLQQQVESLLRLQSEAERFMPIPADGHLPAGTRLGTYEITGVLGAGGMADVYRAHDHRLGRDVAIKILPDRFDRSPERLARLEREARILGSLDHPRIARIHGVERTDARLFLVLELVEGQTLADRLAHHRMEPDVALETARQIAEALEAAHARGIVHRDLKPANVKLMPTGSVKLLDFGLAKAFMPDEDGQPDHMTATGLIVGTARYMSPEQARGLAVDGRTDVWAFGCVLFEMLAGRRAFEGDTPADAIAEILAREPEWSALPPAVPVAVQRLLRRCLQKDPERRVRDIADVRLEIEQVLEEPRTTHARPPARSTTTTRVRRGWRAGAVMALLLTLGFFFWRIGRTPPSMEALRAVAVTSFSGSETYPSLSPDGNFVTYAWTGPEQDNPDIYVQQIGVGDPLRRTTDTRTDYNPVWSPDGRSIAFLRARQVQPAYGPARESELLLLAPLGGSERKLTDIRFRVFGALGFLTWTADSRAIVVTDSQGDGQADGLVVVSVETGDKRPLTRPPASFGGDCNPAVSSDGRRLAFVRVPPSGLGELHVAHLGPDMTLVGEPTKVTGAPVDAWHPAWMPDGAEILLSTGLMGSGGLWRMPLSREQAPRRLPLATENAHMPVVRAPPNGGPARLVYARAAADANIWQVTAPAAGAPMASPRAVLFSSTQLDALGDLSPDGRRVVFVSTRGDSGLWVADLDGSPAKQLLSVGETRVGAPRWSPDGRFVTFHWNTGGRYAIYVMAADGGEPRRVTSHTGNDNVPSFSRDGAWIYFASTRTGRYEVWKAPVAGGDAVQVTTSGGFVAFEGLDAQSLYYTKVPGGASTTIWRVPLSGGEEVPLIEGVISNAFAVLAAGIYYVDKPTAKARLRFFDFGSTRSTTVADDLGSVLPLLTSSRDGGVVLYTRNDIAGEDLMMVENFR